LPQKRLLALVSILQGVAAAEIINTLHLRDFRSRAIFEFFNTIRQKRSFNKHPFCELMSLGKIGFAGPHFASDWLDAHRDLWRRWMQEMEW
jgi:hypothetical protein